MVLGWEGKEGGKKGGREGGRVEGLSLSMQALLFLLLTYGSGGATAGATASHGEHVP